MIADGLGCTDGLKADIATFMTNVRFTPNSRHCTVLFRSPLSANNDQIAQQQIVSLFDHFIGAITANG
jgi:hypothetical protein